MKQLGEIEKLGLVPDRAQYQPLKDGEHETTNPRLRAGLPVLNRMIVGDRAYLTDQTKR
jgi:hypothetical protein